MRSGRGFGLTGLAASLEQQGLEGFHQILKGIGCFSVEPVCRRMGIKYDVSASRTLRHCRMNSYPNVRRILEALFSIDTGLSEAAARQSYLREAVCNDELRQQVSEALADPDLSWCEMLSNEEYVVAHIESNEEARDYALELLSPERS